MHQGRNTFRTCFGETGLKIGPDVFRYDNCEQFFEALYLSIFFHFLTKKKREAKLIYDLH